MCLLHVGSEPCMGKWRLHVYIPYQLNWAADAYSYTYSQFPMIEARAWFVTKSKGEFWLRMCLLFVVCCDDAYKLSYLVQKKKKSMFYCFHHWQNLNELNLTCLRG